MAFDFLNNLQQLARLHNIFGDQQAAPDPAQAMPQAAPMPQAGPMTGNAQIPIIQPRTDINQQYLSALQNMPQRTDPGRVQKVLGMIAGMGAGASPVGMGPGGNPVGFKYDAKDQLATQDQVANAPYYRKLSDWQNKLGMLGAGATEENKFNTNSRLLTNEMMQRQQAQQKIEETERANKEKESQGQQKVDIAKQRADIAQQRADVYHELSKGGTIQHDMNGDTYMVYKDGSKKNVDLKVFTADELNEMKVEGRLREISATNAGQMKLEAAKEPNRQADIQARGEVNKWIVANVPDPDRPGQLKAVRLNQVTGEVSDLKTGPISRPSANPKSDKAELPSQTKVRIYNKAQQAVNEHPEWQKYITLHPGNMVTLHMPGINSPIDWAKSSDAELKKAGQYIYGSEPAATTAPKAPTGWKYVAKPGGGWTAVEDK